MWARKETGKQKTKLLVKPSLPQKGQPVQTPKPVLFTVVTSTIQQRPKTDLHLK